MWIWLWNLILRMAKCYFYFFLSIQWTAVQALANITSVSQPPASPYYSGGSGKRTAMSSKLNLVMTTIGFVVSAIFIVFVLVRLLCARLRSWRYSSDGNSLSSQHPGGDRRNHGIDPLLFPTIKYFRQVFASQEDTTCIVCLEEYEDRDYLRILPRCGHAFHVKCIDAWLRQHSTCPVCRIHLQNTSSRKKMPSPLLSEVARSRFTPGAIPESLFEQPLPNARFVLSRQNLHASTNNAHIIEISETKESSVVAHHSYYQPDHN